MRTLVVYLAGVCLLACAAQVRADEGDQRPVCDVHAELAERFMRHRQETNDLEAAWRISGLIRNLELSALAQRLVYEAYKQPRRMTDEEREKAAADFAETTRQSCLARDLSELPN